MVRTLWFPILATLLLTVPALRAGEEWPVPRGPSHEPNPVTYDAKNYQKLRREYREDSAACVLYAGNTYLVEPDGTVETITHDLTRLNGRKAIEKLGEYRSISYTPSYQKLTLNEARIHKVDGRIVSIAPRHLQLRDVATDYQVYDRDKQLIISFPALDVGDTIEVKWTVRGKNPEHGGHFFTRYSFGDLTYPVVLDELRVRLPRNKPFKFASVNGKVEPVRTESGDQELYRWGVTNIDRPPQDENLPPKDELRPSIVCSTFVSWDAVAQWKHQLRTECWKCTEDLRKVVQDITRGITDPTAKAQALTYWLRRNIRYVSAGEKHDYTPHLPGAVLANRFGDCKDTSQMLAVMLREAGIQVELATLGTLDDGQVIEAVPSPWGTHAILLATIDGKQHWIDTTASLAGWDFLPHDDRGRLCYLVDEKGKLRMERTPASTYASYRVEQTTQLHIGADGSSRSERTVISHGSAAMAQRDMFLEVPVGERRRQVASELQDSNNATRLVHLRIDEAALRDLDRPTQVEMVFEIPNQFSGTTELEGSFSDNKLWSRLLAHNIDFDREIAVQLYTPFESRHRYIVHLHPAHVLESIPRNYQVKSAWGEHTRKVKVTTDGLEVEFFTRLKGIRIEPDDFDQFRKFQEDITKSYRAWLNLKPVDDLAKAPLLEAMLRFAPDDKATAAILARLYQQNHKLAEARAVLQRARYYRPDDLRLWELAVKSADTKDEERLQRQLVERFPDDVGQALVLADILIQHQHQTEARKLLRPLTKKGTAAQQAQALYYLARSHYRTNEADQALKYIDQAGETDADTVQTVRGYTLRGQILEDLGRPRDAVFEYLQASTLDRDADTALDALVRLSLADNKPEDALTYLRRYVVSVGDEVSGQLLAAEYYLRMKRWDDAFDLANRVREQTFHEKSQRILGLVWFQRGDWARAAQHLDKASLDADVLASLLQAFLALGKLQEAGHRLDLLARIEHPTPELTRSVQQVRRLLAARTVLLKDAPTEQPRLDAVTEALGYLVCAEEAYREGRPRSQVEGLLKGALPTGLEPAPALAFRARFLLDQGKLTRAVEEAEQALKRDPKLPNALYVRGRVRQERAQPGALADLEKANELSGKSDADILNALAEALAGVGRIAEAVSSQREAVKLKPANRDMREQLDTLEKRISPSQSPRKTGL